MCICKDSYSVTRSINSGKHVSYKWKLHVIWINFFSKLTLNSVITIVVNDEMMKWWNESKFWVFDPDETFICYRGCLNLNCYIGKKVQKIFLMGLKIWWSWGSGKKISKTQQVGDFSKIDPQLDDYQWWFWVKFWGFDKKKSKSL